MNPPENRSQKQKIFKRHRFFIAAFVLLMLYSFVPSGFKAWSVSDVTYVFHTVDFELGFCTRILPGALYSLFFRDRSPQTATIFESILLVLLFLMTAYLCERLLLSVGPGSRTATAAALIFFLTGPCTFSMFVNRLGMIDFYWILFSAVALILLEKKRLVFAVVPIFFLLVLNHYASVMDYIPWLWMIMLYKISCTGEKKEKRTLLIVLALSVAVTASTLLYFVMFERNNLVYSREEFDSILLSRGAAGTFYYDTGLYRDLTPVLDETQMQTVEGGMSGTGTAFSSLIQQLQYNFSDIRPYIILPPLILILPCLVVLFGFIHARRRNETDRFKRLLLSVSPILFVLSVVGECLLSTDLIRWLGHGYICFFAFVLYVVYREKDECADYFKSIFDRLPSSACFVYFIFYAFTVIDPYIDGIGTFFWSS